MGLYESTCWVTILFSCCTWTTIQLTSVHCSRTSVGSALTSWELICSNRRCKALWFMTTSIYDPCKTWGLFYLWWRSHKSVPKCVWPRPHVDQVSWIPTSSKIYPTSRPYFEQISIVVLLPKPYRRTFQNRLNVLMKSGMLHKSPERIMGLVYACQCALVMINETSKSMRRGVPVLTHM